MGQWTIIIHGIGIHHNGVSGDADAIGRAAVQRLRDAGSTIFDATLTLDSGKEDDLTTPSQYPGATPEPYDGKRPQTADDYPSPPVPTSPPPGWETANNAPDDTLVRTERTITIDQMREGWQGVPTITPEQAGDDPGRIQ